MSVRAREAALDRLRADLRKIHVVEMMPPVIARVHDLLARHPLRASDAIHLSAALCLAEATGRPTEFVVYDERLAAAARAERLIVLP